MGVKSWLNQFFGLIRGINCAGGRVIGRKLLHESIFLLDLLLDKRGSWEIGRKNPPESIFLARFTAFIGVEKLIQGDFYFGRLWEAFFGCFWGIGGTLGTFWAL